MDIDFPQILKKTAKLSKYFFGTRKLERMHRQKNFSNKLLIVMFNIII